jgi:hypothetical protein
MGCPLAASGKPAKKIIKKDRRKMLFINATSLRV